MEDELLQHLIFFSCGMGYNLFMLEMIKKTLFAVRAIGLRMTMRTAQYAWRKYNIERRFATTVKPASGQPQQPGKLIAAKSSSTGADFLFDEGFALKIEFLTPTMIQVDWTPNQQPHPYAVIEQDWPAVDLQLEQQGDEWLLSSSQLTVKVHPCGSLEYLDAEGKSLRAETPPQVDGTSWSHISDLHPDACIYGLGERAARLDLRPGTYQAWNTEQSGSYHLGSDPIYMTAPVYLNLAQVGSFLVYYANSHDGSFSFQDNATVRFIGGGFRYYFISGEPDELIHQYSQLTGRASLPPRWSLGFHQSRWGYACEADIREVVAGFKQHDLPLDVIHLDIDYMRGFRLFTIDSDRFPDLGGLTADLLEQGIHTVAIVDAGVKIDPDYYVYQQGLAQDAFCTLPDGQLAVGLVWPGWSVFPDFTDSKVREWWAGLYQELLDSGIAGIWHDMNEPACMAAFGDPTLPRPTRHSMEGRGGDHQEAHNVFGLLMDRAGFEGLRKLRPERRPWLLTRSGWAGLQRYAWLWTGDVDTSWDTMRLTIAVVLSSGLSGIPYNGPDIGGFTNHAEAELFTRWFQMSALLPFFRNHAAVTTPRSEPWMYGEPTLSICRKFLKLRRRLLPYLYTLAWQANQSGAPLARPLFWHDPHNMDLWQVDDAFMMGEALLVAPVLQAGVEQREVILPAGDWYDYWSDELYQGGKLVTIPAALDSVPLLVRGGSVLPLMGQEGLELHIYPPARDEETVVSDFYDDAGDGYGDFRIERFMLRWQGDALELSRESEGSYSAPDKVRLVFHGVKIEQIIEDGKEIKTSRHLFIAGDFRTLLIETR